MSKMPLCSASRDTAGQRRKGGCDPTLCGHTWSETCALRVPLCLKRAFLFVDACVYIYIYIGGALA